jgi:SNF2 family DNA or RNA helicase
MKISSFMAKSTEKKDEKKIPEEKKISEETKKINPVPVVPQYNNLNASVLLSRLSLDGDENLKIDDSITPRLFDHQVSGIIFMFRNFKQRAGCILADDMGLGKTVQVGVFVTSLIL